jgi:DNA replication protein DnaD
MTSFGDSSSITSLASGDTNDKRSTTTNDTVTDLTTQTITDQILTIESLYTSTMDNNSSELIQNVIQKFQLQKSDYIFLKNILSVLETEQMQMVH